MKPIIILVFIFSAFIVKARDIVPFEISPINNLPHVEVFVNNDSLLFNFLLDTGCSAIFVNARNERLIKLLNLCESDTVEYAHSTSIIKKTGFDNSLMLGSLVADSIQIFVDEDPSPGYDGVIGQSLLERFSKVGIMPDTKIIIFCEKGEPLRIPSSISLPLVKGAGVYGTNLTIKTDSCEVNGIFMLDTGFDGILAVNPGFSKSNNLPEILKRIGNNSSTDGGGKKGNSVLATAPRLIFANESMPLLPILLDVNSPQSDWRKTFNGIIGYDMLKRFRMIWDYENMTISLTPGFDYFSPVTSVNRQ
jgi:hypothetical protein